MSWWQKETRYNLEIQNYIEAVKFIGDPNVPAGLDYDDISNVEESGASGKWRDRYAEVGFTVENPPLGILNQSPHYQDGLNNIYDTEISLAAFAIKPLQALKSSFTLNPHLLWAPPLLTPISTPSPFRDSIFPVQ